MPPTLPSAATYKPKTRAQVRLNQQIYRDISQLTHMPLATVIRHGDKILNQSMAAAIKTGLESIKLYAPKATGQIRESLSHQLRANSTLSNNWLQLKLGTYVSYMKYVARMKDVTLQHPRGIKPGTYANYTKYPTYQRNTKLGKKGQAKRHPGQWRYVYYYGAPRWVKLEDPQAQTNFFQLIVAHIQKALAKSVRDEIQATFKAGERKAWTDRFQVQTATGGVVKP